MCLLTNVVYLNLCFYFWIIVCQNVVPHKTILLINYVILQIQNEGTYLQPGAKDALLNALLLAAKRFSSGPHQVFYLYQLFETF